jgi:Holliday junction resolvase RusA-like endonuclease
MESGPDSSRRGFGWLAWQRSAEGKLLSAPPFRFTVPLLPPSVNHYKKPKRGGGWYRAAESIAFIDAVCVFSGKTKVTGNFYALELFFFLGPSKRNLSSNDLDNFQKVAIDALGRAGVIVNDGRILDLHVHKRFVSTDRDERTEYFVTGRQLDEGEVFSERELSTAAR